MTEHKEEETLMEQIEKFQDACTELFDTVVKTFHIDKFAEGFENILVKIIYWVKKINHK